jgi:hypothetical protein
MSVATLERTREATTEIRRRRKCLQRAQTEISLYSNVHGQAGLVPRGRLNVNDLVKHDWPTKKNVSASGYFTVRANHFLAKLIMKIPNNPNECKNLVIRVDRYGGQQRWTGLLHHWTVETKDGVDYLTASFNDDMQFLQFLLGPPNPLLPIPIVQAPRDFFLFGPGVWCCSTFLLLNIIRVEGNLWTLPDDPFAIGGPSGWLAILDWADWQVHIKATPFLTDASLWTFIGSRMNTADSVIADTLDDGQLCLTYRRIFTAEGETVTGLLDNNVANGALVFEITDRSGFTLPGGTFTNGTVIGGLERTVLTWGAGFIEDTLTTVTDNESLYPDEYWQAGFLGTFASAPTLCVRDSYWNDLQSKVTHSPATAASVIVGGDNPAADAIVKLIIEAVGNLVGYFLLFGFDSLGTIVADVVMPFIVGTILAWDQWKNFTRATNLGWVHLWEVFQRGAEANAWSLAALEVLRGGFKATEAQTSHTMVIDESTWLIPGLHCRIGDRVSSTAGALQRSAGIDLLFINQVEEMNLSGDDTGASQFVVKCGQNKAAMSSAERTANLLKRALQTISDIGVRLVQ